MGNDLWSVDFVTNPVATFFRSCSVMRPLEKGVEQRGKCFLRRLRASGASAKCTTIGGVTLVVQKFSDAGGGISSDLGGLEERGSSVPITYQTPAGAPHYRAVVKWRWEPHCNRGLEPFGKRGVKWGSSSPSLSGRPVFRDIGAV